MLLDEIGQCPALDVSLEAEWCEPTHSPGHACRPQSFPGTRWSGATRRFAGPLRRAEVAPGASLWRSVCREVNLSAGPGGGWGSPRGSRRASCRAPSQFVKHLIPRGLAHAVRSLCCACPSLTRSTKSSTPSASSAETICLAWRSYDRNLSATQNPSSTLASHLLST